MHRAVINTVRCLYCHSSLFKHCCSQCRSGFSCQPSAIGAITGGASGYCCQGAATVTAVNGTVCVGICINNNTIQVDVRRDLSRNLTAAIRYSIVIRSIQQQDVKLTTRANGYPLINGISVAASSRR